MKPITVVGAGFSGLTLAYALRRLQLPVRIVERENRPGGLLDTRITPWGMVETAANALLADRGIEELFADLHVEFATRLPWRKRRYIYWQRPRRWPLSFGTTLSLSRIPVYDFLGIKSLRPRAGESVRVWAERAVNSQFEERLLTPALQGIYAGDSERLSASLALQVLFNRSARGRLSGSISPVGGMGELIGKLSQHLQDNGVTIEYGSDFSVPEKPLGPVILCTSAWAAGESVRAFDSELSRTLLACESLPLVSVTAFFEPTRDDLRGFGCVFPRGQKFNSLGVLFNTCIFSERSMQRSETWILGGAHHRGAAQLSDGEIQAAIMDDRQRLTKRGAPGKLLDLTITRWPRALPHYTVEWENTLRQLSVPRPVFLHGNYLGNLGLARIYARSTDLAAQLKDLYVS